MGRSEWLYKAGGGGDGVGGGGGGTSQTTTKPPVKKKTTRRDKRNNSSSGCMTAIFKLFDIQNHQFRFHHPSFMTSESSAINNVALQGVEAPRNSLQSPESMAAEVTPRPSSSSSKVKKEQINFNIPMKIKTKRSDDLSSECSNSSPSTKTPNLVARLMGLDLLPEYSSPRPSSSSSVTTPANSHHRSRSLPATPRISTASRRSTDNDNYNHQHHHHHHRLSLQIDKENCIEHESLQMKMARRRSELLSTVNRQDENDYKSQYAKQIANQVRERISRRLGTDITNTISPGTRRDSSLVLLKPKKYQRNDGKQQLQLKQPDISSRIGAPATKIKGDDSIAFSSSSSPKLNLLDINNNLNRPISYTQTPLMKVEKVAVKDEKCKKIMASERYDLRLKKMNPQPQDEVFVNKISIQKNKKKKSTPLIPNSSTKRLISFKKEMRSSSSSSSSTTRLHQKQVSLIPSSLNSSSYNSNSTQTLTFSVQDSTSTTATSSSTTTTTGRHHFSDHFNIYISRIINHYKTTQWYSPSHPLHPSIFHQIEKLFYSTTTTTTAGERRMIFELVDEFLVEMVKPCGLIMYDKELIIGKLCEKIRNIPAVNCEVLEDIDGLIEKDIGRSMRRLLTAAIESEAEEIVKEIESEIVETMVHEMVTSLTDNLKSFT